MDTAPTNAVAAAAPEAAIALKPAASVVRPIPASVSPAPMPRAAAPINARAAASPRIAGMIGPRTNPATPMIAKAPAIAARPLAISPQLIPPRDLRTGVRIARDTDITSNAADEAIIPGARPESSANPETSRRIPPIAAPAFARPDHSISANFVQTCAKISMEAAIRVSAMTLPIRCVAIPERSIKPAEMARIPVIAAPAFARFSHFIFPNLSAISANISSEAPIRIRANDVRTIFFAIPERSIKPAEMARIPAIAVPAFAKSPHSIVPNLLQTFAKISKAAPIRIRLSAEVSIFSGFTNFIRAWKPTNSRRIPPIPANA